MCQVGAVRVTSLGASGLLVFLKLGQLTGIALSFVWLPHFGINFPIMFVTCTALIEKNSRTCKGTFIYSIILVYHEIMFLLNHCLS